MPNCEQLTYKAREQSGLIRVHEDSELWKFAETWIKRFRDTHEENFVEKFIYLWVTVNAWSSMCVPDITRNHEDAYLIHSMASDQEFQKRFAKLMSKYKKIKNKVNEFIGLAPVFQVLWMRNNRIDSWDMMREERAKYVERVRTKNPWHQRRNRERIPAFAPACAFEHFDLKQLVPSDWPHVLHMIYQIRCNLFHGGKFYDSLRDRRFIS